MERGLFYLVLTIWSALVCDCQLFGIANSGSGPVAGSATSGKITVTRTATDTPQTTTHGQQIKQITTILNKNNSIFTNIDKEVTSSVHHSYSSWRSPVYSTKRAGEMHSVTDPSSLLSSTERGSARSTLTSETHFTTQVNTRQSKGPTSKRSPDTTSIKPTPTRSITIQQIHNTRTEQGSSADTNTSEQLLITKLRTVGTTQSTGITVHNATSVTAESSTTKPTSQDASVHTGSVLATTTVPVSTNDSSAHEIVTVRETSTTVTEIYPKTDGVSIPSKIVSSEPTRIHVTTDDSGSIERSVTTDYSDNTTIDGNSTVGEARLGLAFVDDTSDSFWPVVMALTIVIPSVVVFGVTITVLYRRRMSKPRRPYSHDYDQM